MKRTLKLLIATIVLITTLSSCIYKMPGEDSYSVIPRTNNQDHIGDTSTSTMPNKASF